MKTVILTAAEDPDFGEVGLYVPGVDRDVANSCVEGILVAHDLLEHINGPGEIGAIDDELQALGAMFYVRGQFGYLRKDNVGIMYSVEETIAYDVGRMAADMICRDQYFNLNAAYNTRPCEHDDAFEFIVEEGARKAFDEIQYEDADWLRTVCPDWRAQVLQYRDLAMHLLRIGARKAAKKYRDASRANTLFWKVSDAVNPHAKNAEEGNRYRLMYELSSQRATCELLFEEEDYW